MTPLALITGASGGIGEIFARLAAADGFDLVLVARREDALEALQHRLEAVHKIHITIIAQDLSEEGSVAKILEVLRSNNLEPTILINNAGFGAYGLFSETEYAQEKQLIAVNIAALTELTKKLLPAMVKRGEGKILNVASTAAFQPGPLMAVYYASKAYVMHLSLALSEELRGSGVTVTCLCPGPTNTNFEKSAHMGTSRLFTKRVMDATTVAKIGYRAMHAGRPLVVAGRLNALGAFLTRFIPRMLAARIARAVQAPLSS